MICNRSRRRPENTKRLTCSDGIRLKGMALLHAGLPDSQSHLIANSD
jgi:hypothetical protein